MAYLLPAGALLLLILILTPFILGRVITRRQHRYQAIPPAPGPETPPQEPIRVTRRPDQSLELHWPAAAAPPQVAIGPTPAGGSPTPLPPDATPGRATFPPQPWPRPYFHLQFQSNPYTTQHRVVAERTLPLRGTFNFRDIGGYATSNGQQVRWGQVYRSALLAQLKEPDQALLHALGIRQVIDLRTSQEREKAPNRLPAGIIDLHLPLYERDRSAWGTLRTLLLRPGQLDTRIRQAYVAQVIEGRATSLGQILQRIADPAQRPILLHCTAGKDRTGLAIALLLLALGVPDETFIADFTLSNAYQRQVQAVVQQDVQRLATLGVSSRSLLPLLTVSGDNLRHVISHIQQQHGSIEAYLHGPAGVPAPTLNQLRAQLLLR